MEQSAAITQNFSNRVIDKSILKISTSNKESDDEYSNLKLEILALLR